MNGWIHIFLPALLAAAVPVGSVTVERETFLMGTRLRAVVEASSPETAASAIEAAFAEVRRMEALLSSWRHDSALGRLNRALPGEPVRVEAELFALLLETRRWAARSDGAFEPAVGALIDAWDLRGEGRRPAEAELARALGRSGPNAFRLNEAAGTVVRVEPGSWMTAGGFGKGAALRSAGDVLSSAGVESALLDFGGQVLAIGRPPAGDGWRIGVAHPSRRGEEAAVIRLLERSAATSAASERFVELEGERVGHILDPRTGRPVPAWGSVTVVAADAMVADLLSTALFVLGPADGMAWAASLDEIGVLFLRELDGRVEASWNPAMEPWLVNVTGGKDQHEHGS